MRQVCSIFILLLVPAFLGAAKPDGIAWHEGDVQSAFDLAERDEKPLFLYWGAVWCPPCNQVKKTIFTRREFIEKSRLFVPVYLDGDTESAQVWAEKLQVSGYPTMLVLDPGGREIMRLPTGLQIEAFTRVLDDALARMEPIDQVLESALSEPDPDRVDDETYQLLAFYSWDQERWLDLPQREKEAGFRLLAERVPARLSVERSRIYLRWLQTAFALASAEPQEGARPYALTKARRREADRRLQEILVSPELTIPNLEFLSYAAGEVMTLLHPKQGRAWRKLAELWLGTMERVENDATLSVDERLSALLPAIQIHELRDGGKGPVDSELRARLLARVRWADESADDSFTRQAAISTAGYLLKRAGLVDEARKLYLAEIEKSESPFYFMSSLAAMAEKAGEKQEAISWLARAYENSHGRATRFQWGTNYLLGLMEITPEDTVRIRGESMRVFKELLGLDDAFAGRNRLRIERLAERYAEWNAEGDRATEIAAVREALIPACDELSDDSDSDAESLRARCTGFFAELGR